MKKNRPAKHHVSLFLRYLPGKKENDEYESKRRCFAAFPRNGVFLIRRFVEQ